MTVGDKMTTDQAATETITGAPASQILSYQKRPPRRRRWLKFSLFCVAGIIIAGAGLHYGPDAVYRAKLLYEQAKWMNYHAPPDQIVLFQDKIATFPTAPPRRATAADAMLLQDANFKVIESKDGADYLIGRANAKLGSFLPVTLPSRYMFSGGFLPMTPPTPPPSALLYCGGRSCAAGERLLVVNCTGLAWGGDSAAEIFSVDIELYEPATLRRPIRGVASNVEIVGRIPANDNNSIQFFAGQSDANDGSRFTIRYMMNGVESMIEGRLQPDGTTVVLNARGPLFTRR